METFRKGGREKPGAAPTAVGGWKLRGWAQPSPGFREGNRGKSSGSLESEIDAGRQSAPANSNGRPPFPDRLRGPQRDVQRRGAAERRLWRQSKEAGDSFRLEYNLTLSYFGREKHTSSSSSVIHGFLNNDIFLIYDSKSPNVALKSCGNVDVQKVKEEQRELRKLFWHIASQNGENGGSHTLQVMYGCELQTHDDVTGFWDYIYDGQKFLSFSLKDWSWIGTSPEAQRAKEILDKNEPKMKIKTSILGDCPALLKKCLQYQECLRKTASSVSESTTPVPWLSNDTTSGSSRRLTGGIIISISIFIAIIILFI